DGLARLEVDVEMEGAHAHPLRPLGHEVDLDTAGFDLIGRAVAEGIAIELTAQLAVDARQQVLAEARGHTGGIVVGRLDDRALLAQIGAHEHAVAAGHAAPYAP